MSIRKCAALALAALSLVAPVARAQAVVPAASHPFSVMDLVSMQRISDPQLSPDGRRIVFVVRSTDLEANRGRTDLWIVDVDGKNLRPLTSHAENESSPAWSPDGRSVYFLAGRGGSEQVWRLPLDGGEASAVTSQPLDVDSFRLSPDGRTLALSMRTYADCADAACAAKRVEEQSKKKATGTVYDALMIRHWDTWLDGRRNHVFTVPVAGGTAVDLMKGMNTDCPGRPFGGVEDYAFTPDGKGIVFSAKTVGAKPAEEAWTTNYDLYLAPADGSAAPRNLTASNPAWDARPVFSPDGRTLAYLAMSKPGYEADRYRIMLRGWPEGEARELAPAWDRSPSEIVFSPDGKTLYATADNLGHHSLFAIDVATGKTKELVKDGNFGGVNAAAGLVVVHGESFTLPAELFTVRPDGSGLTQITNVNKERLATARMGGAELFTFTGAAGRTVYGWVVKPVDFVPTKSYPVAFLIHGGPQGSWNNDFHYRWNPQTYAGAGYAVVMVDFTGSTGYGQAFTDAIKGDWGGAPLIDLQKGLEDARAKYPWLSKDRGCALGASFGGYMVNWIAGAWPDGFQCLVSHSGTLDEAFGYFDTEELWFPEYDHGGLPWEKPDYAKHNPVALVKNWKTPMLVVHGSRDYRVVVTQGIGTFNALQRKGIPSRFLHFPDENHWVLKPANSILWHETVIDWLNLWTGTKQ